MRNQEVLVVGAGPTGLTMAIEMTRLGVSCRLIDKALHPARYSQALGVQARTLEQFERYGIAQAAVQRGRQLKHASVISEGKTIVSFPFHRIPSQYPFLLFLPQSETESLLIEHFEGLGGRVERGTELVDLAEKDDEIEVNLLSQDGRIEKTAAQWVVGCDGARSTVRERLQIPFSGSTVGLTFLLGDLELEGPDLPGDELRVYLHHGDVIFIGRLKEKTYRVIVALHSEQDSDEGEGSKQLDRDLKLSDFQGPMDRAGIRLRVVSSQWMTPFRVNDRRAEHIRHNHIFLAGDASHIHSPVGGQGMNTGIQDAANLAWKIAAVRNGADARLLDSYEEERRKVSEQLLNNTSRMLKAATTVSPLLEKIRDAVIGSVSRIPFIQEQVLGFISETAINYRDSSVVIDARGDGSLSAGDRMPNPEIEIEGRGMHLLDPLTGGRHLIIGVNVQNEAQIRERLPRGDWLFLRTEALTRGREEAAAWIGEGGGVVVIRPDGYIGFRGRSEDLDHLQEYAQLTGLKQDSEPVAPQAKVA